MECNHTYGRNCMKQNNRMLSEYFINLVGHFLLDFLATEVTDQVCTLLGLN